VKAFDADQVKRLLAADERGSRDVRDQERWRVSVQREA
jgi:hypothetical protein